MDLIDMLYQQLAITPVSCHTDVVDRLPLPLVTPRKDEPLALTKVFDRQGRARALGKLVASGGEGSVYRLVDSEQWVVKIYHGERLNRDGAKLQKKIEAAIALYQQIPELQQLAVAWPE